MLLNTCTPSRPPGISRVTPLLSLQCNKINHLRSLSQWYINRTYFIVWAHQGKSLQNAGKPEAINSVLKYITTKKLHTGITSPRLSSTSALPSTVCPNTKHLTTRFCGHTGNHQTLTGDNLNLSRSHYETYRNYFPTCSSSLSSSSLLFLCRKTALDSSLNFWSKISSSAGSWKHCGILIFCTVPFKNYTSSKYS